ncbi:hypothetical protein [Pseudothioclava arenosa]|uniref:Uncharacterized protein n=1 Tax=Pseudothioclava arenosa TaxID=1795308 RepID=A0A2A4CQM9_9RHOB|nr:hypothetical protein [Pseudothioclava arenosa]PCD76426.1 hypothetical protein CLN94_09590 [Pseudothioclava arenosa]
MTRISFKAFTSMLAAAAIALGALAATTSPAAAMGKQDKQVLGALIGLGVLAAIVDSANDNRRDPPPATRYDDRRWDRDYDRDDRWRKPAHVDRRYMIPAQCVENVRIRGKLREVVSGRCIARNRVELRLPRECRFDIRDRHGDRTTVYGRNCLEQEGYRVTRR